MKRGTSKKLTTEDRILWNRVARTATPLPGKTPVEVEPSSAQDQPHRREASLGSAPQSVARHSALLQDRPPRRLDAPTREKLARGRIGISGRVDLHGLTQREAHALLLSFLRQACAGGRRYVLVITGKGSGQGEGVLRRVVPQWFSTPPFASIVGGFEEAARHHGGSGALYVRLRRKERGA